MRHHPTREKKMPENRARMATRESAYIEGEPFPKPHARRLGQRKKLKRDVEVPLSEEPQELRELPDPARVARADDAGEGDVRISDYGGPSTITRGLDGAADMSGSDSENDVVVVSYNWGCDVSRDGGTTWKLLSPYTVFPNTFAGGFCCDQVVLYVPHVDLFVWFLQYGADAAGQGAFRIAVATSDSVLKDPTAWTYWDFVAGDFGWPTSDMDYPDLSYSNRYLYASTDVMGSGRVTMRIQLEELRAGGTINFEYTDPEDGKNVWGAHLVQQTTDMGLWAGHQDNSNLRLYRWPDGSGTYTWNTVGVAAWPNGTMSCTGPDGTDWLTKLRDFPGNAVTGAVQTPTGDIALAWTASNGQANGAGHDFKQSHVRYVEVNLSTNSVVREIPVWNDDYAFAYPSLARAGDHVGIVIGWGGAADHSNCAMGIMGDFVVWFIDASTKTTRRFGDYLTCRYAPRTGKFSAYAVWYEAHATDSSKIIYHPYFARFGRP
jgi:hypothetical protein